LAEDEKRNGTARKKHERLPYKEKEKHKGDDQPRVVEEIDTPSKKDSHLMKQIVPRKCKVHRTRIEGLNYTCGKCGSVFCLACITNVLLPEEKCMICGTPVEISDEFRPIIDRATQHADAGMPVMDGKVIMIAPEIWQRFEELGLEEDVIDEVIDRLKYVPPEDRLKYINAYFNDMDEHDDPL